MVRSMTAYGKGEHLSKEGHFVAEIRSLNRKHLEIFVELPRELRSYEADVRRWVTASVSRGKVDVKISASYGEKAPFTVAPNLPLVRQLKHAWNEVVAICEIDPKDTKIAEMLCRQPELFLFNETFDESVYQTNLRACIDSALSNLCAMKELEGRELEKEIAKRLSLIKESLDRVESHAELASERLKERLMKKLEELLPGRLENEERLLREICLYTEKVDVAEELTRLASHLQQFDSQLVKQGREKGKTFEFLLQEMHREVNTIGAKSDLLEILKPVLVMKGEIEKIKEQVQNIE